MEIKLPAPLAHLANRPHGRYRLSAPVGFSWRGGEVATQAAGGAVRYDISCDPARGRWYLDASWTAAPAPLPCLKELRAHPVLAVDLNHGHLAAWAVTPDGNPAGPPLTIPVALSGLSASQRDGRLRAAISAVIALARQRGCQAIVIEDLDFAAAREQGRERHGGRPSRGARGRRYRALVSGIPTGRCPAGSIRTVIPAQPRCVSGKLDQITASQGNLARRPVAESSHGPRRRLATGAPPANAASS